MSLVLQSLLPYPNSCQGTSPHQQGWDTKMAMLSFCGIDVSKDRLDVGVLPRLKPRRSPGANSKRNKTYRNWRTYSKASSHHHQGIQRIKLSPTFIGP